MLQHHVEVLFVLCALCGGKKREQVGFLLWLIALIYIFCLNLVFLSLVFFAYWVRVLQKTGLLISQPIYSLEDNGCHAGAKFFSRARFGGSAEWHVWQAGLVSFTITSKFQGYSWPWLSLQPQIGRRFLGFPFPYQTFIFRVPDIAHGKWILDIVLRVDIWYKRARLWVKEQSMDVNFCKKKKDFSIQVLCSQILTENVGRFLTGACL